MSFFKEKIVGIDFHDYSAEIVEISIKGNNKYLEAYSRAVIPVDIIVNGEIKKKEELKEILKSMFQNANPHPIETKTVAITFPPSKVITHTFVFPAGLSEKEIKKAITYEAETIIPFAMTDIYWDFTIIDKEDSSLPHSSQYVLFACINKQIADQYCDLFEEIEINPVLFSVTPDSLRYSLPEEMLKGKTSLIIDVNTLAVNYLILKDLVVKHIFSASEGGHKLVTDIAADTKMLENAIIDLKEKNKIGTIKGTDRVSKFIDKNYKRGQKIIEEYEASGPGKKVEQVLLIGKFANMTDFIKLAKTYFPKCNVEIGDPKLGLIIEPARFNLEESDKDEYVPYSIYFNNSIGSALRALSTQSVGINLLPDKLRERFDTKKKTIILGISTVLMTLLILLIGTYVSYTLQSANYQREILKAAKSATEKMIYGTRYQEIKTQISNFNKEVGELSIIDHSMFSVPVTIDKVYKLMPEGVVITSFAFKDNGGLEMQISGIADDRNALLAAQNNLKEANFVADLIAPISNYDEKTQISFQLTIKLEFTKLNRYGSSAIAN
ncbi:MAG: pilus assembly protein PilM [Candidatus Gracilibacteria bacterium]|jgi:type IV pilus assembly protein PilM